MRSRVHGFLYFFVSSYEIIHSHMDNVTIYRIDEVVVFFAWKSVSMGHLLLLKLILLLLLIAILLTFENWFWFFCFCLFLIFWKSGHCGRHQVWRRRWFIRNYSFFTPYDSSFGLFMLLFRCKLYRFRIYVCIL